MTVVSELPQTRAARRSPGRWLGRAGLYLLLLLVLVLWGAPMLWMLVSSIKPESEMFSYPIRWWPGHPTFSYYALLFERFPMLTWFRNSAVVAIYTTTLTLIVDALAAYPLARMEFRGRKVVLVTILATFLMPFELLIVPLFLGLSRLGVADSFFSLSVPMAANAFGVFLFTQFFAAVPRELEEAATIDGCSRWGFFWRVLIPLARPAIVTVTILTFVGSWNNFFWPLIVSNSDETRTLPVGLAAMVGGAGMSMQQGVVMASAVMATLPAVAVFLLLQRFFVQGIATSGMKG
ncbi:carbohydrate ABC transporter permease [Deinococcus sp.]|uniref:carbohydrate ABC transporter permease n=1 Tax=Deinococcus sp. TaxID=47478 RepID=UPI003CC54C2E